MKHVVATVTLMIIILLPSFAAAQNTSAPGAAAGADMSSDADPAAGWTQADYVKASLYGAAVGGAAAFGLGYLGYQVDGHCVEPGETCAPVVMGLGAYAGLIGGSSTAVYYYGRGRGFRGKYSHTLIGSALGSWASGIPSALAIKVLGDDAGTAAALAFIVTMPALGAAIAFKRSITGTDSDAPTSGALVDVRGGKLSLSVPALALGVEKGGVSVYVPVAGGAF